MQSFCFGVFNFSPVSINEDNEPIWFKWLRAVEVEFFLDEVKDILEGVVGVRESEFFKGALYLSFWVVISEHGDKQFFVVFIYAFPGRGKDGGSEGVSESDTRDFKVEVAEGEVKVSVVEAIWGVFWVGFKEKFSFFKHDGV